MKTHDLLGLLWVAMKFLEYQTYDMMKTSTFLAILELPVLVWWFVESMRHIASKDKNKTSAYFEACVAGLFSVLWLIFFAMGVLLEMKLL